MARTEVGGMKQCRIESFFCEGLIWYFRPLNLETSVGTKRGQEVRLWGNFMERTGN
jgi:hypothetical protein